jgi:hypothetical protein
MKIWVAFLKNPEHERKNDIMNFIVDNKRYMYTSAVIRADTAKVRYCVLFEIRPYLELITLPARKIVNTPIHIIPLLLS